MGSSLELEQHFLKDITVAEKMAEAANLSKKDVVLEIGPGKGIITRQVSIRAGKVIAVEKDKGMAEHLYDLPKNVEVIYGNALEKIEKLEFNKIIANIPFSMSEPLLRKLMKMEFDSAVLMTGKSFYELLFDAESKWSVIRELFFDVEKILDVGKEACMPMPRTDCVVFKLAKKHTKSFLAEVLLQDDKKLKNALLNAFVKAEKCTKNGAKEKIRMLKLPPSIMEKNTSYLSNAQFDILNKSLAK